MKIKVLGRLGASVGAIMAVLATGPAFAATSQDLGPVSLTWGGFIAMEGLWRDRDETADIGSSFSGVPFSSSPLAHVSEMRFTARQSRLSLLVQGNVNSDLKLSFWQEMDFLGAGQTANSNESNSYNLRIRNIYTTADWADEGVEFLAGQNWSLLTLNSHGITPRNEVTPATIDAQYSVGFNWARQPQLRVVKNWNHEFWAAFSVENPQTTFAPNAAAGTGVTVTSTAAGGSLLDKNNNYSLNHVPDIIGKLAWEPVMGDGQPLHLEVFGLYRDFYDRVSIAASNNVLAAASIRNTNAHGGGVGGSITYAIPHLLDLQATAMTGTGIGRYGSGQLPDVTFQPGGAEQPLQETTFLLGATLHASPVLDIYTYLGQEAEKPKYYNFGVGNATHTGAGNPALALAGCSVENGTCSPNLEAENQANVGIWWRAYQGDFGSFRLGLQYSYTHLTAMQGVGLTTGTGAAAVTAIAKPSTDDSMIFTSVRYYPF